MLQFSLSSTTHLPFGSLFADNGENQYANLLYPFRNLTLCKCLPSGRRAKEGMPGGDAHRGFSKLLFLLAGGCAAVLGARRSWGGALVLGGGAAVRGGTQVSGYRVHLCPGARGLGHAGWP